MMCSGLNALSDLVSNKCNNDVTLSSVDTYSIAGVCATFLDLNPTYNLI
jgi:hypothetical protein